MSKYPNWYQEQQARLADILDRGERAFRAILGDKTPAQWLGEYLRTRR